MQTDKCNNNHNCPPLRFCADNGSEYSDWSEDTLGNLGTFDKGKTLSKSDISESGTPMILYGELYTQYDEIAWNIVRKTQHSLDDIYITKGHEVIIPCSGETAEDISTATCVIPKGVALGGDLIIYNSNLVAGEIISYILNHQQKLNIAKLAQGKSVVHISVDSLKKLQIMYPTSEVEQQKIIALFSAYDEKIVLQKDRIEALEDRKKGLLQKIFSQEIRFKANDGSEYPEWEECQLKKVLYEYKEKCEKDGSYEHVSLTKEGVVPKTERYDRDFLVTNENKEYRVTHYDDICYNPANLKFGVICRNEYGDAIFSPIYVTFKVNKDFLPKFVEILVTRKDFINYSLKYQEGTVYERMAVSPEDLLSITVKIPKIEEQKKIADFFTAIDAQISFAKEKLETLQEIKKGLLQQMFC